MRTATTPTRCAATGCSNWRSIVCPRARICARNRPSRGWKTCPDRRALLRLAPALVEQYCGSFRAVPKRIVLDIDDIFDRVRGAQQLRLFNACYDLSWTVNKGSSLVTD